MSAGTLVPTPDLTVSMLNIACVDVLVHRQHYVG
jgi:hypothetical protein